MHLNLNHTLKNFKGEDLKIGDKPQFMFVVVAQSLFAGEFIEKTGNPDKDCGKKLIAYDLCSRLMKNNGEMDVTAEEAVMIKESIANLTAGCYSQIVKFIDG